MRSRNIKPTFYKNEDLAECSIWARYIYPGLWMIADREGRLEDRPKRIKAELLPMDGQEVEPLLAELAERGFIVRYSVDGQALIWIPAFLKHQNPHHREQSSELPPHQSPGLTDVGNEAKPQAFTSMSPKPGALPPLQGGTAVLIPDSLIPDSLFSDSMPTNAGAPTAVGTSPDRPKTPDTGTAPPPPATPPSGGQKAPPTMTPAERRKSDAWAGAKSLLHAHGMASDQIGGFLGKLASRHGEDPLVEAMEAALVERPADPAAWIVRACQNAAGQRKPAQRRGRQADFSHTDYGGHGAAIPA